VGVGLGHAAMEANGGRGSVTTKGFCAMHKFSNGQSGRWRGEDGGCEKGGGVRGRGGGTGKRNQADSVNKTK